MPADRLLLLFARSPREERRHKPLGRRTDGRRVEALHQALLERTLEVLGKVEGADVRVATTGELDEMRALCGRRIDPARLAVEAQTGGELGARLAHAVGRAFEDGYRQVVVVGGDAPELEPARIEEAFARLKAGQSRPTAVLGPALDGGYYLLGLSAFAEVFTAVALGTCRAAEETAAALEAIGFSLCRLAPLGDVDDLAAVIALSARLRGADPILRALLLSVLAPPARPFSLPLTPPNDPRSKALRARGPPILD